MGPEDIFERRSSLRPIAAAPAFGQFIPASTIWTDQEILPGERWHPEIENRLAQARAVAGCAGYFPARRAARVDPLVALRYE